MIPKTVFHLCCALAFGWVATAQELPPAQPAPNLRPTLELIYDTWQRSLNEKDLATWQQVTARSRQMETQNRIVSQQLPFPATLLNDPIGAPSLAGLTALGAFSTGQSASSVYYGRVNFGEAAGGEVPNNVIVLQFLKDGGVWKFDTLRLVKFGPDGDLLGQLRAGDLSFLSGPEFQPARELPRVQPPVTRPDFVAEAWVGAVGAKVSVSINGNPASEFANARSSELLMGGVRRGTNRLTIQAQANPKVSDDTGPEIIEVGIYAAPNAQSPAKRVFYEKIPATSTTQTFERAFVVE